MNEKLIALAIFLDIINEEDWDFNQDPPVFMNFEGHEQVITEDWDFSTSPPTYVKELEEDEEPLSWEDMNVPLWDELDLPEESRYDDFIFDYGKYEYLVCTDDEADERVKESIESSVWAFNPDFIIRHSKLPWEAVDMVEYFCRDKCESANETILALIDDIDEFVSDAISTDGRGHFLSNYDGKENEQEFNGTYYYIYKI